MSTTDGNWFSKLFIDEVKPALNRHSGSGGAAVSDGTPITVSTETEMDNILANATASDMSKIYRYTGVTGKYEQNAYYILEEGSDG